jgi:flagellar biosynthetic protein FliR
MEGGVITLPAIDLARWADPAAAFLFAMLRIGVFLAAAPGFSGRFVPLPVRIVATVCLALPVAATPGLPGAAVLASLAAVPLVLQEIAIGLVAGLVLTVIFGAAALAGDHISNAAGLGFAAQFDPTSGGQSPVVAQLFGLSLLFVFFAADGHLTALRIVLDSYAAYPPGTPPDAAALAAAGIGAGAAMFALAAAVMLPVVAGLILMNLAVGVVTRAAPQMNVFSVGFPLALLAALALLWLTAPVALRGFQGIADAGVARLGDLLAGPP